MSQITLEIPAETLLALKVSEKDAGGALRMAAAMKLFELGQLSSGAAARLAGVPRVVFLSRLAEYGVDTFNVTAEDLRKETHISEKMTGQVESGEKRNFQPSQGSCRERSPSRPQSSLGDGSDLFAKGD